MRQHVNPLSRLHQLPRPLPLPDTLFEAPQQPLHLDIGCGRGRFLLELAAEQPLWNHLGLEIRRPLVEAAEAERRTLARTNLGFVFCNASVSLEPWLLALPAGLLQRVSIQFPDPWFKKKHHKRRLLQPALLHSLAGALPEGGWLFLQSDVIDLIEPMVALCEASGCFRRPAEDARPWRADNPLPVASERERHAQAHGLPVWRVLFLRNREPLPALQLLEAKAGATHNPAESARC